MKNNKNLCWIFLFITVLFVSGLTSCKSENVKRSPQSKAKAEDAYSKERKRLRWFSQCGEYNVRNKNGQREERFSPHHLCTSFCNAKGKYYSNRRVSSPVSPSLKARLYSKETGKIIYEDTLKKYRPSTSPEPIDYEDPNADIDFSLEGTVRLPEYQGVDKKYIYRIVRLDKNNKEIVLYERSVETLEYLMVTSHFDFNENNYFDTNKNHECLSTRQKHEEGVQAIIN